MPIIQNTSTDGGLRTLQDPQRRYVGFGLLASLLSITANQRANAQTANIPQFRSGRYQFTILQPRRTLPSVRLFPLKGQSVDLFSLRGRPILLNFWAAWCEACRTEMPILDQLQADNRISGLQVIAISEDGRGRAPVERFVNTFHIGHLKIYLDPNGYVAYHDANNPRHAPFALYGLPITYAIAASGWVVGYMPGAADWASPAARTLINFLRRS